MGTRASLTPGGAGFFLRYATKASPTSPSGERLRRVQMRYALLRTVENVKKGSDALRAVEKVKKGRPIGLKIIQKSDSKSNKNFFTRISQISLLLILLKRNYLRIFVSFAANPLQR